MKDGSLPVDAVRVPRALHRSVCRSPEGRQWLADLPSRIGEFESRWSLRIGVPIEESATASWVAPCDRSSGEPAILKLGFPHMEATHEIDGLVAWDGDPTVRLHNADRAAYALLLERCEPGTPLTVLPEPAQDEVIAGLLRRLWRRPPPQAPFRPLRVMIEYWMTGIMEGRSSSIDPDLTDRGLATFESLLADRVEATLLATDLHAGNVLRAAREEWLVIDPKPFVGDRCYDATQHVLNCRDRLSREPLATVQRVANLLDVDTDRVRRWTFARLATERGAQAKVAAAMARELDG